MVVKFCEITYLCCWEQREEKWNYKASAGLLNPLQVAEAGKRWLELLKIDGSDKIGEKAQKGARNDTFA